MLFTVVTDYVLSTITAFPVARVLLGGGGGVGRIHNGSGHSAEGEEEDVVLASVTQNAEPRLTV